MGFNTQEFTATSLEAETYVVFDISPGILHSMTIFGSSKTMIKNNAYCEIGIGTSSLDSTTRQAVLAAGYVGSFNSLFFTGHIPIESDDNLFVLIFSLETALYRVNFKLTPESSYSSDPTSEDFKYRAC